MACWNRCRRHHHYFCQNREIAFCNSATTLLPTLQLQLRWCASHEVILNECKNTAVFRCFIPLLKEKYIKYDMVGWDMVEKSLGWVAGKMHIAPFSRAEKIGAHHSSFIFCPTTNTVWSWNVQVTAVPHWTWCASCGFAGCRDFSTFGRIDGQNSVEKSQSCSPDVIMR